jgi:hypothetical protein
MAIIERIGVPGEGMWLGSDGIWNFEDQASYVLNEPQTLVASGVTSHLQREQTSHLSEGT